MRHLSWSPGLAVALGMMALATAARAATEDWIPAGHLTAPNGSHSATRLADGRVLVAGGGGSGGSAVADIYDPATHAWTPATPMSEARADHTAALLPNGRVLVAGGFGATRLASAEIYDPGTGSWTTAPPMSAARNYHTATLLMSGKVLVVGGYSNTGTTGAAEIYDPVANAWQPTGALAYPRAQHRAVRLADGRVLVSGGFADHVLFGPLATVEIYDPASGTWSSAASMTAARYLHSATLLADGRVMVAGGTNSAGSIGSVEVWTVGGAWSPAASLGVSRHSHGAALLPDGRVLVAGGLHDEPPAQPSALTMAQIFDPVAGTWSMAGPMAAARYWHSTTPLADGTILVAGGNGVDSAEVFTPLQGTSVAAPDTVDDRILPTATTLFDGRILVAGGFSDVTFGDTATAEIYDPAVPSWTATASMPASRYEHTATRLLDGRVVVTGGHTDLTVESIAKADLFDPASGTWTTVASMAETREQHAAQLLPDGRVLVCGGYDEVESVSRAEAELFSPDGTWATTGSMTIDRAGHTSTRLRNGKILIVGGYDTAGNPLASAELFDPAGGTWTATGDLAEARYQHTATLLEDGRVLVAGGSGSVGALRDVALFDPATGTWTPTGSLTYPRYAHTATLLLDGRVLVAGGFENEEPFSLRSTELYDPASGTWHPAANMLQARNYHTASGLADGSVLLVNGAGQLFSTERFIPDPGPPSRPLQVVAAPGDGLAAVSWSPPAWNGGSAISYYSVIVSPGGTIAVLGGDVTETIIGGLSNGSSYAFTVTATNALGTGATSSPSNPVTPQAGGLSGDTVSGAVAAQGGSVTTGSAPPTAADPVETTVVVPPTPDGGTVTIAESGVTQTPPSGYSFAGQEVTIVSTAATTPTNPLMIAFTLDASIVAGQTPQTIQVMRSEGGGAPAIVPDCAGPAGVASPDPCVSFRGYINVDDIRIVVLASTASIWDFAVPVACEPPEEVASLQWSSVSGFQWTASAGAAHWNAYRGTIPAGLLGSRLPASVYDLTCLESADQDGDGATTTSEVTDPPTGTGFFYLVTGESACGEGILGRASSGSIIPNASPCPTPP